MSSFGGGGRTDAQRMEDRPQRSPVHLEVQREILACTATSGVLQQVDRRRAEMDAANFATALQRIAKICDHEGSVTFLAPFDSLLRDIRSRMDEFRPFYLTTISWAVAKASI